MLGSFRIGRLFGIPVYVHFTFVLFLGVWALFNGLSAAVLILAVFGSVLLHEFGHALTARAFGVRTRDVTLLPIGGVARLERMPENPAQELWIALAGPAVNVAIAGVLMAWLTLTGAVQLAAGMSLTASSFVVNLLGINVLLALFNLLPAFPMDGGRVLRALLASRMSHLRATELAARVGRGMAFLFAVAALFGMPMLLLIAIFVWFGAGQELAYARQQARPRVQWQFVSPAGDAGRPAGKTYRAEGDGWVVEDEPRSRHIRIRFGDR